jgi:energy-coupling factor transporter ATP-binding protein EcfA2
MDSVSPQSSIPRRAPGSHRRSLRHAAAVGAVPQAAARPAPSLAAQVVELALSVGAQLYLDRAERAWVRYPTRGHWEVHPVQSQAAGAWLRRLAVAMLGSVVGPEVISTAVSELSSRAVTRADVRVRVAEADGRIYLDLADDARRVVEIDSAGWRVLPAAPPDVLFARPRGTLPLPAPEPGGRVEELRRLARLGDEEWWLVLGWLMAAVRPSGPYPLLILTGPQGAGKTVLARMLTRLVDPRVAALRAEPASARDLAVACANAHVLAYDNVSSIPEWLSDAMCRVATGAGYSARQLYSDLDEVIIDACRPVIITSIVDVAAGRPDLADRAIILEFPAMSGRERRSERDVLADFAAAAPRILGGLLDAVSQALRALPSVALSDLPRMADFSCWVCAGCAAAGVNPNDFLGAYAANRQETTGRVLEGSQVAAALQLLVDEHRTWRGTMAELLSVLGGYVPQEARGRSWPRSAQGLRAALRRLHGALGERGIVIRRAGRAHGGVRLVEVAVTSGDRR